MDGSCNADCFSRALVAILALSLAGCRSGASEGLAWHECLDGLECATLDVPSDYEKYDGARQSIAVGRARAGSQGARLGVLVFNLGGPGEAGVRALPGMRFFFSSLAPELTDRFDLIAFDPRGVEKSSPAVRCVEDSTLEGLRALDPRPDDQAERAAQDAVGNAVLASCSRLDEDFANHVDTESVARDLDALRAALGEASLNYYGGSYGTLLGAMYATLFPSHARALVLDSAVMPGGDRLRILVGQAEAYEQALADFLTWCESAEDCALAAHGDAVGIGLALDTFSESVEEAPLQLGDRVLSGSDVRLSVGMALNSGKASWPRVAELLDAALLGDEETLSQFLRAADAYYGRGDDGRYDDDIVDAFMAIGSLDAPFPEGFTRADFDAFVEQEVLPVGPHFGPIMAAEQRVSLGWPFARPLPLPAISAPDAPPSLVLAGLHDASTPLPWAEELRAALGNGSSLITNDDWVHGQLLSSECVRDLAVRFLVDPTSVPPDTACPAETP